MGGRHLRRPAPRTRARRARPAAGAPPLLLEERQVAPRLRADPVQRAGLLGDVRLPRSRGSMARAAVQRRLTWLRATVSENRPETARVNRLLFDVPQWSGHLDRKSGV